MAIIEINNLNFYYDHQKNDKSFYLSVPSWQVEKGSFFSIIGPNGCGKSTLLKLIAGLLKAEIGSIKISGINIEDIKRKDYSKKIAYVPQSVVSIYPFSVYEIIMMGRTPYMNFMGFDKKDDRDAVNEATEIMKLSNLLKKGINELSGGEVQRVFIARALAQKADIILLDEPNSHLDLHHQIVIFDLLKELSDEKGLTIIAVSHDLNMVGIYSKDIVFMNNGTMVIFGNKKEIFTKENIRKVFDVDAEVTFINKSNTANVLIKPQS